MPTTSYGAALLQALLALALVCIAAWVLLRFFAAKQRAMLAGNHMRVIERVLVGGRSSLVLVQIGDEQWMVGVAEGSAPRLISKVEHPVASTSAPKSFSSVMKQIKNKVAGDDVQPQAQGMNAAGASDDGEKPMEAKEGGS